MPATLNSASIPNVRASSGTMGTTYFPTSGSFNSLVNNLTIAVVVDSALPLLPVSNVSKMAAAGAFKVDGGTALRGR